MQAQRDIKMVNSDSSNEQTTISINSEEWLEDLADKLSKSIRAGMRFYTNYRMFDEELQKIQRKHEEKRSQFQTFPAFKKQIEEELAVAKKKKSEAQRLDAGAWNDVKKFTLEMYKDRLSLKEVETLVVTARDIIVRQGSFETEAKESIIQSCMTSIMEKINERDKQAKEVMKACAVEVVQSWSQHNSQAQLEERMSGLEGSTNVEINTMHETLRTMREATRKLFEPLAEDYNRRMNAPNHDGMGEIAQARKTIELEQKLTDMNDKWEGCNLSIRHIANRVDAIATDAMMDQINKYIDSKFQALEQVLLGMDGRLERLEQVFQHLSLPRSTN